MTYQRLLLVAYSVAEALVVDDLRQPDLAAPDYPEPWSTGITASARALQPSYGLLSLTSTTTLDDVAELAAREGWTIKIDVEG